MSPQDKAKQLVEKYLNLSVNVIHTDCEGDISIASGTPTQSHAKQCALICANEIRMQIESSTPKDDPYANLFAFDYWNEVKTEIEKI